MTHPILLLFVSMQLVSPTASIVDVDTNTVSSMVITLPVLAPGDEYDFLDDTPLLTFSSESPSVSSLIITYNGTQPLQTYVDLLLAFQYRNTLDEPGMDGRMVFIQVFSPSDTPGETIGSNVAMISIQIVPLNDNPPEFTQSFYSGRITENAPMGTLVGVVVAAVDGDVPPSNITFTTTDPFFSVDPVDGVVSSRVSLDAEFSQVYNLTVMASDFDGAISLTSSVLVRVNVIDLNDNPPVFAQPSYSVSVREDVAIGTTILTILATDEDVSDANSEITYMIFEAGGSGSGAGLVMPTTTSGSSGQGLPFMVDMVTGAINVTRELDFDGGNAMYEFMVIAIDSGLAPLTGFSRVRIRLTDVNDNAPMFVNTLFSFEVGEDAPVGSPIVSIMARDADIGANGQIQFSLRGTSTFSINPTTGLLSLSGQLDFETNRSHSFVVVATDLGSPSLSSQATVTITVLNVNDNRPLFSQPSYTFTLPENSPFLVEVPASDEDGDTVTYREVSGFVPGIQLDIFTGEISSAPGFILDFEVQNNYSLVVEAADSMFSTTVPVSIVVQDLNDNAPTFSQDVYVVEILESLPVGSSVVRVTADDRDETSNAIIEYSLQTQDTFAINNVTGVIFVSGPLDFDRGQIFYSLTVTARNPVPPYFVSSATVNITLRNVNDISPLLTLQEVNITFIENSDPIFIALNLVVMDGDGAEHPLAQCSMVLAKVCTSSGIAPCLEALSVDEDLARQLNLSIENLDGQSEQRLVVSGNASDVTYQSLLRTLQYGNPAPEPVPGVRSVQIQCQDGSFFSNVLDITVSVQHLNEFCPTINASRYVFNFVEDSVSLQVGSLAQFSLFDQDSPPHNILQGLRVTLGNHLDGPSENISVGDSAGLMVRSRLDDPSNTIGSGDNIFLTQTLMLLSPGAPEMISVFERALRSLVYTNVQPEPTLGTRQISILPMDQAQNCTSVDVSINIIPVNDNPPELIVAFSSALQYLEESGQLAFAAEAGLMVRDLDHNSLFPMQSATVILDGILDFNGSELLGYNASLLPVGVIPTTSQGGKSSPFISYLEPCCPICVFVYLTVLYCLLSLMKELHGFSLIISGLT